MFSNYAKPYQAYPDQEWVWGSGANGGTKIDPAGTRLLSPGEFDQLDSAVKGVYGGYMGYLNAYARQQKANKNVSETYESVRNGTYEPPEMGGYAGAIVTPSRKIPTAGKATGGGIPSTIHRDMSGNVTEEIAGGGVRRGLNGEIIPQTGEQIGAQTRLDRTIPVAEMEADTDYLNTLAAKSTAEYNSKFNKRQEALIKSGQAQQKINQGDVKLEQGQQRLDDQNTRFKTMLDHQGYMEQVRQKGREALLNMRDTLNTKNAALDNEYAVNMATLKGEIPGTPESQLKHAEISARQIELLKTKAAIDKTEAERKDTSARLMKQQEFSYWLEKLSYKPDLPGSQKPDVVRAAINARTAAKPQEQTPPAQGAQQVSVDGQIFWAIKLPNGKWKRVQ